VQYREIKYESDLTANWIAAAEPMSEELEKPNKERRNDSEDCVGDRRIQWHWEGYGQASCKK
jgi:hypothetical protein